MKTLYDAQNAPHLLRCLVARRKINSNCKTISFTVACLSVLGVILGFITTYVLDSKCVLGWFAVASSFAWILAKVFGLWIANEKRKAAQMQQYFDLKIYSYEPNALGAQAFDVGLSDSEIAEIISSVTEKDISEEKVENWYQKTDGLDALERVFDCQRQCVKWEISQRKMYLVCATLVMIGMSIAWFYANSDVELQVVTYKLFLCGAFLNLVFDGLVGQVRDLIRLQSNLQLVRKIEQREAGLSICPECLIRLQNCIYEHRVNACYIPDWFYSLVRSRLQQRSCRVSAAIAEVKGCKHA